MTIYMAFVTFRGLALYGEKIGLNARAKMTNLIHSQKWRIQLIVQSLEITKLNNNKANRRRISA